MLLIQNHEGVSIPYLTTASVYGGLGCYIGRTCEILMDEGAKVWKGDTKRQKKEATARIELASCCSLQR